MPALRATFPTAGKINNQKGYHNHSYRVPVRPEFPVLFREGCSARAVFQVPRYAIHQVPSLQKDGVFANS
jgi:hypothetical protein